MKYDCKNKRIQLGAFYEKQDLKNSKQNGFELDFTSHSPKCELILSQKVYATGLSPQGILQY